MSVILLSLIIYYLNAYLKQKNTIIIVYKNLTTKFKQLKILFQTYKFYSEFYLYHYSLYIVLYTSIQIVFELQSKKTNNKKKKVGV